MPRVVLTRDETPPLRAAMLDVQSAVARYYAETARGGDSGVALRGFLMASQVVNDLLTNQATNASSYKALFDQPAILGTDMIEGVKYARNVQQHVLHIVRPSDDKVMVGGPALGYRDYEKWAEVPATAHSKLTNKKTQSLKAAYDSTLFDKPVVGTMLDVLKFYQAVNPEVVHRDDRGEWTGFPLMDQPGMRDRLHPEEPSALDAARDWLDARVPNGNARVVCGQITFKDTRYLCGFTFTGRNSFSPFAETIGQVERDLAQGAVYLEGDVWANVDEMRFPRAQGPVFSSRNELDSWASRMTELGREDDWCLRDDTDYWLHIIRPEQMLWPSAAYLLRRARRLNACVPPSL